MNHTCLCLPSRSWYSFIDPGGMEGWADLGGWLVVTYWDKCWHQELNPDMVTHPSTNQAGCRLTSLIETNALLLRQTAIFKIPAPFESLKFPTILAWYFPPHFKHAALPWEVESSNRGNWGRLVFQDQAFVWYAWVQSLSIKLMDVFKQAYRKLARMMIQEVSSVSALWLTYWILLMIHLQHMSLSAQPCTLINCCVKASVRHCAHCKYCKTYYVALTVCQTVDKLFYIHSAILLHIENNYYSGIRDGVHF